MCEENASQPNRLSPHQDMTSSLEWLDARTPKLPCPVPDSQDRVKSRGNLQFCDDTAPPLTPSIGRLGHLPLIT
ncbi:hypothetical protein CKAH01_16666 [Colletotrichum kahawae]|uniref:Uncharacterized protein n=1 Tax=Colletotrichum kahawae TaxID=34407 RepID=A0AAD9YEW3_COLKA|nr:hypothetical protein CKAH01_16666 [Colletotrichum kahawae]